MSLVKFERIVSVSSEDPDFPADNLLKSSYNDKKWKCKTPGEKQISLVIQLNKPTLINAIDIGNYGSAFIEIFVGKSSNPDDFKILVVASSLMMLQEAKLGENITNVRFFKEDSLAKPIALEKWDRLKLVCSQPYNKFIQYGLSFLVVHSKTVVSSDCNSSGLGNFTLKPKKDDDIASGSFFAKRKEASVPELKGAAAIRAASYSGVIDQIKPSKLSALYVSSDQEEESEKPTKPNNIGTPSTSVLRKDISKRSNTNKQKNPLNSNQNNQGSSSSQNGQLTKKDDTTYKKKNIPIGKRIEKPFNKLMEGVVFAISGFQNPIRSELRSKALSMGAKYRPDWDNTCTHLLCAFPNTPKFNQVLGHGKIFTKDWIENCYTKRMRLPWRRYALHPPEKKLPESEEEIFENVPRPASPVDNRRRLSPGRMSSGEDTEDEIERVRMIQKKQKHDSKENTLNKNNSDAQDISDVVDHGKNYISTQVSKITKKEPECIASTSKKKILNSPKKCPAKRIKKEQGTLTAQFGSGLPVLFTFYDGLEFFIGEDLAKDERKKVARYIIAHKGSVSDDPNSSIDFIISRCVDELGKLKELNPMVIGVRPEWVWMCHDRNYLPIPAMFEIK